MVPVKILQVTPRIFDCFLNDGWEEWSRWYLHPSGYLHLIGGKDIPSKTKSTILSLMRKDTKQ